MLTLNDLKITPDNGADDPVSVWERVEVAGRKFLVGSCDLSTDENLQKADAETLMLAMFGVLPEAETWVMEATDDWQIANPCNEECATGVCKKRLASNREIASQELGYRMLLDALNA